MNRPTATGSFPVMEKGQGMWLLPPQKDRCQVCASKHEPEMPHNAQSLYYQTKFNMENGRGATWLDAMAHCAPEMQKLWTDALTEKGVDVAGGGVNPAKPKRERSK